MRRSHFLRVSFLVVVIQPRVDTANSKCLEHLVSRTPRDTLFLLSVTQNKRHTRSLCCSYCHGGRSFRCCWCERRWEWRGQGLEERSQEAGDALAPGPAATLPFSFPHFFVSTYSVRKFKDVYYTNINSKTVLILSFIIAYSFVALWAVLSVSISVPSSCSPVLQVLEAACNPLLVADYRHLSRMQGRNDLRATIHVSSIRSRRAYC